MSGFDQSKKVVPVEEFRWVEDRVETSTKNLGGDNYIELAKYITGADQLLITNAGLVGLKAGETIEGYMEAGERGGSDQTMLIDMRKLKLARMFVYIKAWNAKKTDGSPLALTRTNIELLSEVAFNAIDRAIDEHLAEIKAGKTNASPASGEASSTSADT